MPSMSSALALVWQIAASEAMYARHQFIEREHIFIGILKIGDLLGSEVIQQLGMSSEQVERLCLELESIDSIFKALELNRVQIRRHLRSPMNPGNYRHAEPVIHRSTECKKLFEKASQLARSQAHSTVHSLHMLVAILEKPGSIITKALSDFGINTEDLKRKAWKELEKTPEKEPVSVNAKEDEEKRKGEEIRKGGGTHFLDRYGRDLTSLARQEKLDPLIGRRQELLQMIRTLTRKKKNNPLLIGEAGVGKTAIVEGLAQRIASANLTPLLRDRRIVELNLGALVANTKFRGEFEERLTSIVREASAHPEVILFIDEIHTVVGGGAAEGAVDAANILKSALARGEISCIGATTVSEYRKHIEKDSALERRFQPIMVKEASPEEALEILEKLAKRYQKHYKVNITASAVKAAVEFSLKYLPDRCLPDKAIDLLDEACSRVKVPVLSFLGKDADPPERSGEVTEETVAQVLSEWTGIPVRKPTQKEKDRLLRMAELLKQRIFGQNQAVEKIAAAIQMAKAGLKTQKGPMGVFLFLGPTGVGKTELAKALAEFLFGSEDKMIRLDMSEYTERHSVSKLIGAPPGYVGYDEEGQLTGKLRRTPHAVVLLDEIEKAHPEVFDLFLQVFDEGRLTDSKGRTIDAKECLFIMTSNLGSSLYQKYPIGFRDRATSEGRLVVTQMNDQLKKTFKPEFLNRIDEAIIFNPLGKEEIAQIAMKSVNDLRKLLEEKEILLEIEPEALELLCEVGYDVENGARPLKRTIKRLLGNPLSQKILKGSLRKGDKVCIKAVDGKIMLKKLDYDTIYD